MKTTILLSLCLSFGLSKAQTINYKGCYNLFNNQDYVLTKTGTDTYGKGIYITTPVTGDQPCGGFGICEFKIQWNNTNTRWEFLADQGDGDFVDPYVVFYNATGSSSAVNPPSNTTGEWIENTAITQGECGGSMSGANSTMTGDVHTSTLALSDFNKNKFKIYPNPVKDVLNIIADEQLNSISIYDTAGRLVVSEKSKLNINVSKLSKGLYIIKIETKDSKNHEIKFIKE